MDFFGEQDRAKRSTKFLVLLFLLDHRAVHFALFSCAIAEQMVQRTGWWNPELFFYTALGVGLVTGIGSLVKTSELSHAVIGRLSRELEAKRTQGPFRPGGGLRTAVGPRSHSNRRSSKPDIEAITTDGTVSIAEAELLPAIGARLDVPVPPLLLATLRFDLR